MSEYGEIYWQRLLKRAKELGKEQRWLDNHGHTGGFEIELYALSKDKPRSLEATSDHVVMFFTRCGLSPSDFGWGNRKYGTANEVRLCIRVNSFDVFVWILEMPVFELCGQRVCATLGDATTPKSYFLDSMKRNSNAMPESKWLANLESVMSYQAIGAKKENAFEAAETKVLIWGEQYGQIPTLWPGSKGRTVIQAACGDRHVAFLTDVGQVITTGDSAQGQVGNGPSWENVVSHNVVMPSNIVVRQIACGNTYTLALTETNNVFYWGTCKYSAPSGPYDVPKQVQLFKANRPTLWEALKRTHIEQIASGAAHMLFLRKDNRVLSVGAPGQGRLGRNAKFDHSIPNVVSGLEDIAVSKISCGYANSLAYCSATGHIYVWGQNSNLQCGIDSPSEIWTPTLLSELKDAGVSDVVCGLNTSYAITDKGPYAWGVTATQFSTPSLRLSSPMLMTSFIEQQKTLVKIAVGGHHALGLGPNGEVYSWGQSHIGQCGHGDTFTYIYPTRIHDLPPSVSGIAACGSLSIAFTGLLRTPISENIETCLNNPDSFPDIIFQVGDTPVYAHRALIVARCHQLKIMHLLLGSNDPIVPASLSTIPINAVISRFCWPGKLIPNESTPGTLHEPVVAPYSQTFSSGSPVTPGALLCVLRYIYTDTITGASSADQHVALAIAHDFGLRRLEELLSPSLAAKPIPSSYCDDLDLLVQSPSDYKPETAEELTAHKAKQKLTSLVGAFADLTLVALDSQVSIHTHRFLLCARSDYFQTLLHGGMIEAQQRVVELQTDESTCRWLLRFLYTDRPCTSDINITVELLKLSAMIQLHRLVFLCSRFIEKELDIETTAYMYHLTSTHSITTLRDICWGLMTQNFDGIIATDYWQNNLTQEERDTWLYKYQNPSRDPSAASSNN
jgi:hypothetical protein